LALKKKSVYELQDEENRRQEKKREEEALGTP